MSGMQTSSTPFGRKEAHHQHGLSLWSGTLFTDSVATNNPSTTLLQSLRASKEPYSQSRQKWRVDIHSSVMSADKDGASLPTHTRQVFFSFARYASISLFGTAARGGTEQHAFYSPVVREGFLVDMESLHIHRFFLRGFFYEHVSINIIHCSLIFPPSFCAV